MKDNYAYIAVVDSDTLEIVDISDPSNPQHKGSYIDSQNLSRMRDVFVSGNYAYGISGDRGTLEIINVSNPVDPVPEGAISYSNLDYSSVFVSGGYAYLTRYQDDVLEIIDVSVPSNPVSVANISNDNFNGVRSVFVSGGMAYLVSSLSKTLEIVRTGYSTLSGTYNVGTGEVTPLLNVGLITAHDAISLDGMRTNSSKTFLPKISQIVFVLR